MDSHTKLLEGAIEASINRLKPDFLDDNFMEPKVLKRAGPRKQTFQKNQCYTRNKKKLRIQRTKMREFDKTVDF